MSYKDKYMVTHSHLITKRTVIVNELHAEFFVCLVNRLHNREMENSIIIDGHRIALSNKTVANHILMMFDLIGLQPKGKTRSRNRMDLVNWAKTNRFLINPNGTWQLNDEFLIR